LTAQWAQIAISPTAHSTHQRIPPIT